VINKIKEHPKRVRHQYYVRHILPSDSHEFVGRIYDLSIVEYHFDNYEELSKHSDCMAKNVGSRRMMSHSNMLLF
jgi:hypothetical protein